MLCKRHLNVKNQHSLLKLNGFKEILPEEKRFVVYVPLFDKERLVKGIVFGGMKALKTLFEDVLGARYLKADF